MEDGAGWGGGVGGRGMEEQEAFSRWSTTELGIRLGDWISRREERGEDLQLLYMRPCLKSNIHIN